MWPNNTLTADRVLRASSRALGHSSGAHGGLADTHGALINAQTGAFAGTCEAPREVGAGVNQRNAQGQSPLFVAKTNKQTATIQILEALPRCVKWSCVGGAC